MCGCGVDVCGLTWCVCARAAGYESVGGARVRVFVRKGVCHEERRLQQRKVDHRRKRNRSEKDPTTSPAMPAALLVGLRPSWRPMVDTICDAPAVPPRNRNAIADAS